MEIYGPGDKTPREKPFDPKTSQELLAVTKDLLSTGAITYGSTNIQITKTKIAIDMLLGTSPFLMEYIQIFNWNNQMKGYEKLYRDNFFENIQIFGFANFFHIVALVGLVPLIPRIKYYFLYYKGRKLLEKLNSNRGELKGVNDIPKIENISPSITHNP